jgi:hypothetical protein
MGDSSSAMKDETGLRILSRANVTDTAFIFEWNEHCNSALTTVMENSQLSDVGEKALDTY